ncbi:MAG: hypothetical protein CM15mP49_03670 [Actinomycetota bacterium]|nr:MAG: hypothetical protein CM15mP49_03670 [Actinomycetota bacterium]
MAFSSPDAPFQSNPTFTKALDQLLILHADHEQNCSTTAVRVVGSSHAGPTLLLQPEVQALSGPRHGGANEAVLNMLDEIGSFDNVNQFIDSVKTVKVASWVLVIVFTKTTTLGHKSSKKQLTKF